MNGERSLDISWGTLLKIAALVVAFYILYQIKDILVWFVFALIISILINPAIEFLKKFKVPHSLAVFLVYVGFFGILFLLIYLTAPMFVSEIQQFSQVLPQYFEQASPTLKKLGVRALEDIESFIGLLGKTLEKITANILNILFVVFGGIFASIFILTVAIFISLEEKWIEKSVVVLFPQQYEDYVLTVFRKCQKKVNNWFTTRIISSVFVGLATYISLLIFRASYPFSFGLMAGLLNFVPVIGPVITGIMLFIVIALDDLFKALFVIAVFTIIQQIEGGFLMPILSKRFIGLSPVLVLVALAIGGVLWGFLGAVLAVPLAGIVVEFTKDFLKKKREEEALL
ncbi:MAG: hypothetical protein A3H01_02285 [Candidatus Wildermuthbacteria bacterium RIFCSPLOWO2_12_FULL_40_9]|uniref:AI-2E family transporter n=2 Tax=Candidatus Wildermuthiibacteriota TaxID=1817923 RepID=A0A1G2RD85_9BACT|nr:MAG: hypothetical protein A3F15_01255 [Candidatus Wildermuthbacteria bacterium RIFCSPHIGHO2_12_FULL_40_12]OHA76923.1 MAG: hypothetical protein A3H01_02285 [Candidatus Wildermuthbacteria bacterium RIFCSPLOWO2_12_FULL_40_9]